MKTAFSPRVMGVLLVSLGAWQMSMGIHASAQDIIGDMLLQTVTTNVNGAGIRVAQPEADDPNTPPGTNTWEVNPAVVGQPTNLFTYIYFDSSGNYPNSLGFESHHAESVADNFYGIPGGVATNVAHVDNYEADYFWESVVDSRSPRNINDPVVNQSFTFGPLDASNQEMIDSAYDNYSARYGTLFISAANNAGNSTTVCAPGTSYNCVSVGAYTNFTNYSSIGPTVDNGRCKPDITAPWDATSFSTPLVAGAAAVLMQAGLGGDGGADIRTVKALLLNGAIKPPDWTNDAPSPLDYRYGAGVLNVFNSYEQLTGGENDYIVANSVPTGSPHPPTGDTGTVGALSGWDFNTISSSASGLSTNDGVNHYYFNVTNGVNNAVFTATATLVWNRQQNQTNINNLDLFLYDTISSNLIAASTSLVDNVQHLWLPQLPQGRYDLQVLKNAGNSVSATESQSGTNTTLSWPIYPTGFILESTTNLASPIFWSTNNPAPVVTNNQNLVVLNATNGVQFFQLCRP
ncbi:MAG: S8 family serine peptidase [Verrucomicrobiota bacterium]